MVSNSLTAPSISTKQIFIICLSCLTLGFNVSVLHIDQIIEAVFFPLDDDLYTAKLMSISLFATGYLARPFGALAIGYYGDKKGRKPALILGMSVIAMVVFLTGCLPTYSQIGLLAPIIFVVLRLIQGMMLGAFISLSWVFIAEHASKATLAFYCGLVSASYFSGSFISRLFNTELHNLLTRSDIINFAWRIPVFIAFSLCLICIILLRYINETPIYTAYLDSIKLTRTKESNNSLIKQLPSIIITMFLSLILVSLVVIVIVILPKLILSSFNINEGLLRFANLFGIFFMVIGCVFFGSLGDKIGIAKALIVGSLLLISQVIILYLFLGFSRGNYILLIYTLLGFSAGIVSLCAALMVQIFPAAIRLTYVSVTYNVIAAVVGVIMPFGLFYLTNIISFAPAIYISIVGIIALVLGLYFHKSPQLNRTNERSNI